MNTVLFSGSGKEMTMTSRDIAVLIGSRHDNVKKTIERLSVDNHFRVAVIDTPATQEYQNSMGRTLLEYVFTGEQGKRNSIIIVAQLSPEFTAALVDRWTELEEILKNAQPEFRLPNFNNPVESARAWADAVEAKMLAIEESNVKSELINELDTKIERDAPLVEYAKDVKLSVNAKTFGEVAKILGLGPNKLFEFCRNEGLLMSGHKIRHNLPYQQYINSGLFEVKQSTFDNYGKIMTSNQTLITGKGQQYLHNLLSLI